MRQHRRHAVQRAHRAAMQELAVEALGEAAFLEGDERRALRAGQRRHRHVGEPLAMARRRQVDIAFAQRAAPLPGLRHDLDERTAEGNDILEVLPDQQAGAHVEELFGGRIDEKDLVLRPDEQDRHGQRRQNERRASPIRCVDTHLRHRPDCPPINH